MNKNDTCEQGVDEKGMDCERITIVKLGNFLGKSKNLPWTRLPHLWWTDGLRAWNRGLLWEVNSEWTVFSLLRAQRRKDSQGLNWECISLCLWRFIHLIPLFFILILFLSLSWIWRISDHCLSFFFFFKYIGYWEEQYGICKLNRWIWVMRKEFWNDTFCCHWALSSLTNHKMTQLGSELQ